MSDDDRRPSIWLHVSRREARALVTLEVPGRVQRQAGLLLVTTRELLEANAAKPLAPRRRRGPMAKASVR